MRKRFKRLLLISSSALLSFGAAVNVAPEIGSNVVLAEEEEGFEEVKTDWFTIRANSAKATDTTPGVAELEVLFSPVFKDYEHANGESFSQFLDAKTGLIGAIKYILADQVKFIEPVEMDDREQTPIDYDTSYTERSAIFDQFLQAAFDLSNEFVANDQSLFNIEFSDYQDVMLIDDYEEVKTEVIQSAAIPTAGKFLRAMLAYLAGRSANGENTTQAALENLLDIENGIYKGGSVLGASLNDVYKNDSELKDDEGARTQQVKVDIETIYEDAMKIVTGEVPESLALAEIFVLVDKTNIKVENVIEIIGKETVKEAILDCFRDKEKETSYTIPAETINAMLKGFSHDLIYNLCDTLQFTRDEIKDVIQNEMSNDRLMEISKDLGKEGLDNVRIILGMANDLDPKTAPKKVTREGGQQHYQYPDTQYDEFGNDLVEIVLGRMTIQDMIDAIEGVWVRNVDEDINDEHLLYSYNYTPELNSDLGRKYNGVADGIDPTKYSDGRYLYLRNIIEWFNEDFPKLSDLKELTNLSSDKYFKQTYHIEVLSPLNEDRIFVDFTFGFQEEKTTRPITNFLSMMDDAIDFTFDFVEGTSGDYSQNTLQYTLDVRPRYFSNIYEFLYTSDFINNTDDNRLKERLFELTYMTFGDMKDAILGWQAEDMIADCKNLNYEEALGTLLYIDKFQELFKGTPFTIDDIVRIITNLKRFANRGDSLSYDNIYNIISDKIGANFANKLNDEEFKDFLSDLVNLCAEIKDQHISLDVLRAIENEDVWLYSELLSDKLDTVKRVKQLAYKFVRAVPEELNDKSIIDLYNEGTRKITFTDDYNLVWKNILGMLPLGEVLADTIDTFVADPDKLKVADPNITIDLDANLQEGKAKVHTVTYKYKEDSVDIERKGLLPTGAKINDYGPARVGGKRVIAWKLEGTETRVPTMPDSDTVLGPVYASELDFANAKWDYTEAFKYNELEHTVSLTDLPDGEGTLYEVVYENNTEYRSGTYNARATIHVLDDEYDVVNFNVPVLEWKILSKQESVYFQFWSTEENESGDPFLGVYINDGLYQKPDLHAVRNDSAFDDFELNIDDLYGSKAVLNSAYEIVFKEGNVPYPVTAYSGSISVLIPEELREGHNFEIVSLKNPNEVEKVEYTISSDGKYAIFASDYISKIAILGPQESIEGLFDPLPIIIVIIGLSNIILCVMFLLMKKNEENEDAESKDVIEKKDEKKKPEKVVKKQQKVSNKKSEGKPRRKTREERKAERTSYREAKIAAKYGRMHH